MSTHYLIDHEYLLDKDTLLATFGHLLVLNPGPEDASLAVTVYYQDKEPQSFSLVAPAVLVPRR